MKNKYQKYSSIYLALSLVIFSVVIPFIQGKINSLNERHDTYTKNLLNAELHKAIGINALDFYSTALILTEKADIKDGKLLKAIELIKNLYYKRAKEACANRIFLETEPINQERPQENRLAELQNKSIEELNSESEKIEDYLSQYNLKYQSEFALWDKTKIASYVIAIILHVLGVYFALKSKKKEEDKDLVKEIRNLLSRVNTLIKKIT